MARYLDFRVSLMHIKPEIWRRFLLPERASFEKLHEAIQDGFGWEYDHLFEFRDKEGNRAIAGVALDDFLAEEEVPAASKVKLASFFTRRGKRCRYVYDFGDDWQHVVEFLGTVESPEKFKRRLLGGARAGPPEDCGGVYGYEECVWVIGLSDADIQKKSKDEANELAWRKEWIGDWDPEAFDPAAAKKEFDQ